MFHSVYGAIILRQTLFVNKKFCSYYQIISFFIFFYTNCLYIYLYDCSRTRILAKKDKINDKNFAIYLVLNLFYFGFIVSFQ